MVKGRELSSVNVCRFCGSHSPEIPSRTCAHGETASVQGDARQAAARLWIAMQSVETHRAAFGTALDLGIKAGSATIDTCPRVQSPGSNVVFLRDRDVVTGELRTVLARSGRRSR